MVPELQVQSANITWRIPLDGERLTVGKAPENDVTVDDSTVSHLHAVFEAFTAGWCVSDLGSSNGTWVNGERIWSPRRVRDADEIRVGQTLLVFRDSNAREHVTEVDAAAPSVTPREHDVLVALCRPLLARDMFTEPASTRSMAEALVVSDAAIKQHLTNLFEKFGVAPDDQNRRLRLANEAIRSGAVTIADLRRPEPT